jgi:hypothetical protein
MSGKTRKLLSSALIGTTLLSGGLEKAVAQEPDIRVNASTTFASIYVQGSGFVVGKGPVSQTYVGAGLRNFTLSSWLNYDFGNRALTEADFFVGVNGSLFSIDKGLFEGKVSARASVDAWTYPGLKGVKPDYAAEAGIHYSWKNLAELDFGFIHLLTGEQTWDRNKFQFEVSKPLTLANIGNLKLQITPSISTAVCDNFYGFNDVSRVTIGTELNLQSGNLKFGAFVNRQFSASPGTNPGIKDITYYGIGGRIDF